jgi:hypothetical protein
MRSKIGCDDFVKVFDNLSLLFVVISDPPKREQKAIQEKYIGK